MVIVLERNIKDSDKGKLRAFLQEKGFQVREIVGEEETIFGAVGIHPMDIRDVEIFPGVERVIPITKPYKLASRELKKEDTVVPVGPVKIGGLRIAVIAGPCSVETREQILESARIVRESGAVMLRGGAYKPRTSPYAFQGLGEVGLQYLKEAGESYGLPVVSEVVSTDTAEIMKDYVDVFQIGTRNMQNFELLKKVGSLGQPVILKRGMAATIEEWLMAAEYLLAHGADNVVLCERGIRTFETYTRNTLDLSAIPVIKKLSHLPIIVDPSHATGIRAKVLPMALAAIAAGADGLILETHPDPEKALSDGAQSLYPQQFEKLMRDIEVLSPVVGKEIARIPRSDPPVIDSAQAQSIRDKSVQNKSVQNKSVQAGVIRSANAKKEKEGPPRIGFQGEHGAYSETALHRYFAEEEVVPVPFPSFQKVFDSVLNGELSYGILPIENSLAGSIHENYDLLLRYPDITIIGEQTIRIEHSLLILPEAPLEDITTVYSHPQGLAQCRHYLDSHPQWEQVPFYDTAGSAAFVAKEMKPQWAAIAGSAAAAAYGLRVAKEGIETNPRNYTRFLVIALLGAPVPGPSNKASVVFSTPDKPGALFRCLQILAEKDLNMKKLESRPIPGKPWQYMFYVDMEVPKDVSVYGEAMDAMKEVSEDFRVLGVYRA
jgi:3-deoxy-7-phosphoheptulonate synthase